MSTYNLNGLDHRAPSGTTYLTKQIPRKVYLLSVRDRLKNDVGFFIKSLEIRNRREPYIGFFPLVRMIMPIVEVVANSEGKAPEKLLAELGVGVPHITWTLYRDTFIHNDEFIIASYAYDAEILGIQSGIIFTQESNDQEFADKLAKDGLSFDPLRIHRRLLAYLNGKIIGTSDDSMVDVIEQIRFDPVTNSTKDATKKIVEDIKTLHNIFD